MVVDGTTGDGAGEVVAVAGAVDVVLAGTDVVVATGSFVVVVVVVVTTGFGATVVVVVAAPADVAPATPATPSKGPRAMRATPARTIDLGSVTLEPINPLCIAKTRAGLPTVPTLPRRNAHRSVRLDPAPAGTRAGPTLS